MQNLKNILRINPTEAEIAKRMIILSDGKSKKYVFNLTVSSYCFLPRQTEATQQNEETFIGYIAKCSVLMTVRWTVHEIHIYSIQPKKNNNKINEQTAKKDMINSFFFNYNSRIIREYFQAKIGRKIRIFTLARKKQHSYMKKECITKMGRFSPNGDHFSM